MHEYALTPEPNRHGMAWMSDCILYFMLMKIDALIQMLGELISVRRRDSWYGGWVLTHCIPSVLMIILCDLPPNFAGAEGFNYQPSTKKVLYHRLSLDLYINNSLGIWRHDLEYHISMEPTYHIYAVVIVPNVSPCQVIRRWAKETSTCKCVLRLLVGMNLFFLLYQHIVVNHAVNRLLTYLQWKRV